MNDFSWPEGWNSASLRKLQQQLLRWFDHNQRPLPWRQDRDPYRIWLSEVMLQQTTVAAVGPYFERFLKRFPTLQSLAESREDEVLKLWEGLGYYRRAKHLHQAAQTIWEKHPEAFPDDVEVWRELPGIGPYLLGAILSQAFDQKLPIVEANSLRVLSRWFAYRDDPREGPGKKWVWAAAEAVLPEQRVGDFNQALMELGSQTCKIENPNCSECPAKKWCLAHKLKLQNEIPVPPRAKKIQAINELAVVIRRGDKILLVQRKTDEKRWANLWEVPHFELQASNSTEAIIQQRTGVTIELGSELLVIKHSVTRFQITMSCLEAKWISGEFGSTDYATGEWVSPDRFADFAVSSPQRILLNELQVKSRQLRLF